MSDHVAGSLRLSAVVAYHVTGRRRGFDTAAVDSSPPPLPVCGDRPGGGGGRNCTIHRSRLAERPAAPNTTASGSGGLVQPASGDWLAVVGDAVISDQ